MDRLLEDRGGKHAGELDRRSASGASGLDWIDCWRVVGGVNPLMPSVALVRHSKARLNRLLEDTWVSRWIARLDRSMLAGHIGSMAGAHYEPQSRNC